MEWRVRAEETWAASTHIRGQGPEEVALCVTKFGVMKTRANLSNASDVSLDAVRAFGAEMDLFEVESRGRGRHEQIHNGKRGQNRRNKQRGETCSLASRAVPNKKTSASAARPWLLVQAHRTWRLRSMFCLGVA